MNRTNLTQNNYTTFGTTPTILVVNTDITIGTGSVAFADGCVFEFAGGIIKSGSSSASGEITGSVKVVSNYGLVQLFDHVTVPDLENHEVFIEWFGGKCYLLENSIWQSPDFSDQALANAVITRRSRKIKFQGGYYCFKSTVTINNEGVILSGTMSHNRPGIRDLYEGHDNGKDSVSTLVYRSAGAGTFINITSNGTRLEDLLIHELDATSAKRESTAVVLSGDATSIHVDRCKFYNWGKGIYRNVINETNDCGLTRSIVSECFFHNLKYTAIEVNVKYITYNMIRDSWFSRCGCPIRFVASQLLLQDNSIVNCNFDYVVYNSQYVYPTYGCCAIYMESASGDRTYDTNNISRCYFERVGYDDTSNPPEGCNNTAAVICKNTSLTVDNNFFTSTPRYFIIDTCSSISIGDNSIGINNDLTNYGLDHDMLVEVVQSGLTKQLQHSIIYSNSIPICPDPGCSFLTRLVKFNSGTKSRFSVVNYHENRFNDYGPQTIKIANSRSVATIPTITNSSVLQVDYNPNRYSDIGSSYDYHPLRLFIYLHYSVYCDIYEVTINMSNRSGSARLRNDDMRCIYGATGLLPSYDITIQTKSDPSVTGRFYIYVNAPQMNPTFKPIITSDDIRLTEVTALVDFASISTTATTISVRRHRGLVSTRPAQSTDTKGYEFYDTANNRKTVWNGTRWLAYKAEPEGATTSGTTSQRPTSLLTTTDKGFTYFDTTLGKPVYWNGSGWVNANGTAS